MTSLDRRVERLEQTAGRDGRPTLADLIVAAQDPAATDAPRLHGEDELARDRAGRLEGLSGIRCTGGRLNLSRPWPW